jgi:hypothetical protein
MRNLGILGAALVAGVLSGTPAGAESRTFIVPNNADGYGIDRCLANGERCGQAVATNYCQSQSFAQATSFQKIDKDEITGAVAANNSTCKGPSCDRFVAIVCSR